MIRKNSKECDSDDRSEKIDDVNLILKTKSDNALEEGYAKIDNKNQKSQLPILPKHKSLVNFNLIKNQFSDNEKIDDNSENGRNYINRKYNVGQILSPSPNRTSTTLSAENFDNISDQYESCSNIKEETTNLTEFKMVKRKVSQDDQMPESESSIESKESNIPIPPPLPSTIVSIINPLQKGNKSVDFFKSIREFNKSNLSSRSNQVDIKTKGNSYLKSNGAYSECAGKEINAATTIVESMKIALSKIRLGI